MSSLMEKIYGYRPPKKLTDEQIIKYAKRGSFRVSLRYRDAQLRSQCNALVKQGLLVKIGRIKREMVYKIPEIIEPKEK